MLKFYRLGVLFSVKSIFEDLLHEPSETVLLDELESIKKTLNPKTPIGWLKETLGQELWEEEIFQGGDVLIDRCVYWHSNI